MRFKEEEKNTKKWKKKMDEMHSQAIRFARCFFCNAKTKKRCSLQSAPKLICITDCGWWTRKWKRSGNSDSTFVVVIENWNFIINSSHSTFNPCPLSYFHIFVSKSFNIIIWLKHHSNNCDKYLSAHHINALNIKWLRESSTFQE